MLEVDRLLWQAQIATGRTSRRSASLITRPNHSTKNPTPRSTRRPMSQRVSLYSSPWTSSRLLLIASPRLRFSTTASALALLRTHRGESVRWWGLSFPRRDPANLIVRRSLANPSPTSSTAYSTERTTETTCRRRSPGAADRFHRRI